MKLLAVMFLLSEVLTFSQAKAFSDKIPSKLKIEIGYGKVSISGLEELFNQKDIDALETQLLIDEGLASLVMGQKPIVFYVDKKTLITHVDSIKDIDSLTKGLRNEIQKKVRANKTVDKVKIASGDDRVIIGGHFIVHSDKVLDELVVLGGRVEVYGEIKRLYISGGEVTLYPQARITEELSRLGGSVSIKPGAQVRHQVEIDSIEGSEGVLNLIWSNIIKPLMTLPWSYSSLQKDESKWYETLIHLLLTLVFTWSALKLMPKIYNDSFYYLNNSTLNSLAWFFLAGFLNLVLFVLLLLLILVGWLFLPFAMLLGGYFYFISTGLVAHAISHALRKVFEPIQHWSTPLKIFCGLVLLNLAKQTPLLGWWIYGVAVAFGTGALYRILYGKIFNRLALRSS